MYINLSKLARKNKYNLVSAIVKPFGSLVSDFGLVEEVEVVSGRMKGLKGMVLISPDPTIDAYVKVRLNDDRGEEIVAYFLPEELKILK
jgi:hypothetical protein